VAARLNPRLVLLVAVSTGLAGGCLAWVVSDPSVAAVAWAATSVLGLVASVVWVWASLSKGRIGADVVAVLALLGALWTGEYLAGAIVALMLATGRMLESWAEGRSRRELTALVNRVPRTAHRLRPDGDVEVVPLTDVVAGDQILVRTGEVVPVDGVLVAPTVLDESALTGEAMPVDRTAGDLVSSGVVVSGSPVPLRALRTAADSTYAGIVRLVEEAQASSAPFVRMADRFAAWFVPFTVLLAGGAWAWSGDPNRAVAVLVVATPCPLILAAPVALVAGMAQSARRGVVIKGGAALERLALGRVVLFDKTGTLTAGRPELAQVITAPGVDPASVLGLAASLDQASPHVLAAAVVAAARGRGLDLWTPQDVVELGGHGVSGSVNGNSVSVGKFAWLAPAERPEWLRRAVARSEVESAVLVLVTLEGDVIGALLLVDPLRQDAPRMVRALRGAGIRRVVLVTGDRAEVAETIGHALDIDEVFAERLPDEKLAIVRGERPRGSTVFVGDGVNDAPALAAADVGVALAGRGATASSEAADVVLLVDRIDRLAEAMVIARRSRRIAWQSVTLGMGLSLAAMGAAAIGLLTAVVGALLQEVIDVVAILNALRAARPVRAPTVRGEPAVMGRRLMAEHLALKPSLERIRSIADGLDDDHPQRGVAEVRQLHRWLVDDLLPHEIAEEQQLYPAMAEVLGGSDPTGAMSRAHTEILHLVRRLGLVLDDLANHEASASDLTELRRLLYGLHAVLLLHFAQEEEGMFPLIEELG